MVAKQQDVPNSKKMALYNLAAYISEAKGNKFSLISSLEEQDVVTIWRTTCQFIKKQMLQFKGVAVPNLGTFTFSQIKLPIGKNTVIIQRPIFVFSEWFLQTHGLTCTKPCASGQIPVIPLNYTVLSNEGHYNRDSFQLCIKEILLAMSRCLFAKKNVHLDFCDVGRVIIKDSKVQIRFFRSFIRQFDHSGELESIFRPQTAQSDVSIMTNPSCRSWSSSEYILPKLPSRQPSSMISSAVGDIKENMLDAGSKALPSQYEKFDSQQLLPNTALLVCSKENAASSICGKQSSNTSRISTASEGNNRSREMNSSCSHDMPAGQELCYFCHQQNKRNVYIDISDEKKARELQYEKILHNYQSKKQSLARVQEREAKKVSKFFAKNASSHNFGLLQKKRTQREASGTFHHRSTSPDIKLKQGEYCSQLDSQVKKERQAQQEIGDREEKLDREEHAALQERLQSLEEAYSKERAERIAEYKKVLAEQVCARSCTHMHNHEDYAEKLYPMFGVNNVSVENPKQEYNKAILTANLQKMKEKNEKTQEETSRAKQEEAEVVGKAKKELIHEIQTTNQVKVLERRLLEKSWDASLKEKKHIAYDSNDAGLLLHEQCDKYKRCNRCQRHRGNRGESHFHPHRNFYSKLVI